MSRIGNKEIKITDNINLNFNDNNVIINGPKGELTVVIFNELNYVLKDNILKITRKNDQKKTKELHGLSRTLINNAVQGVTSEFSKTIVLSGIGYKVQQKGNDLEFNLGYSHPILFKSETNIKLKANSPVNLTVTGIDIAQVSQIAAKIKKLRKVDYYKGKGLFFDNESIVKKQGKSIKK